MQMAVTEFARDVCGMEGANSAEFGPDTPYPVIDLMPDQEDITDKGGTMRLGSYPCKVVEGTLAHEAYGAYTAKLSLFAQVTDRFEVGPGNFMPPPRVNSAVVRLDRLKVIVEIAKELFHSVDL